MIEANNYKDLLNEEFLERVKRNPSYSKRAFAKLLGVSPGALSELLNGKRKLTSKSAQKISQALGYTRAEIEKLKEMVFQENEGIEVEATYSKNVQKLNSDFSFIISEWYCFGILNLINTKNFSWDHQWIAKRLGVSSFEVKIAIEKLVKAGLLNLKGRGYEIIHDVIETTKDIPSKAIRNFHKSMLEKSISALDEQKVEEREIAGVSFTIKNKDLEKIKKEIRDFQDYLSEKYNQNKNADDVYHLESAFIKISQ